MAEGSDAGAAIASMISEYAHLAWSNPSTKSAGVDIAQWDHSVRPGVIIGTLRVLSADADGPFELFAAAKHGLEYVCSTGKLAAGLDLIPAWIGACVAVGAFEDAVRFSEEVLKHPDAAATPPEFSMHVYRAAAKAHRNLGQYDTALEAYRRAIEIAACVGDGVQIAVTLLLIGKLHGNYLGLNSVYACFVEEAMAHLRRISECDGVAEDDRNGATKYLGACHDCLGQLHRPLDPERALREFRSAAELAGRVGSSNGQSRALCHLGHLLLQTTGAAGRDEAHGCFLRGYDAIRRNPWEHRGLGIRQLQYADFFEADGDERAVEQLLEGAVRVATIFSDYRTIARAKARQAGLRRVDLGEALRVIGEGRQIAARYVLHMETLELNGLGAELLEQSGRVTGETSAALFLESIQISRKLARSARETLSRMGQDGVIDAELAVLSTETKSHFRENLVIDLTALVDRLHETIQASTGALRAREDAVREQMVIDTCTLVAAAIVHEAKDLLDAGNAAAAIRDVSRGIESLVEWLDALPQDQERQAPPDEALAPLKKLGPMLEPIAARVQQVYEALSRLAGDDGAANARASLSEVCESAIARLSQQWGGCDQIVTPEFAVDAELVCNRQLVEMMVANLVDNSVRSLAESERRPGAVKVRTADVPAPATQPRNPARDITLSVVAELASAQAADEAAQSIHDGLDRASSTRGAGWGFGLRYVQKVAGLLRADLAVVHVPRQREVGLMVTIPAGSAYVYVPDGDDGGRV